MIIQWNPVKIQKASKIFSPSLNPLYVCEDATHARLIIHSKLEYVQYKLLKKHNTSLVVAISQYFVGYNVLNVSSHLFAYASAHCYILSLQTLSLSWWVMGT